MADDLRRALQNFLRATLGDSTLSVSGLRRLGGGSSRENWAFDLAGAERDLSPMLLRRDPVASVAETDRSLEVGLLETLHQAPYPTPVVVAADLAGACLDRASVVLARAPGRADRAVLRDKDPLRLGDDGRVRLAVALCDLLVDVHGFADPDVEAAAGPAPSDPAMHEIERWEVELAKVAVDPQPELAYVATWLREHRPAPPDRPSLVHGDFRPANVLVDAGRISVLLDWEFAHWGDPIEDVGWYCAPIYGREHFVTGAWGRAEFLARYTERSGTAVDADRLHFWQVLAMFKLGVIMLAGVQSFLAGETDRAAGPTASMLRAVVASTRRA